MIDDRLKEFIEEKNDACKYHNNKKFIKLKELLNEKVEQPHETQPNTPNLCKVKSVNETAFQRAIFNAKTSSLIFANSNEKKVEWLDLELPITFKPRTSRRKCVDLVGKLDKPFICELKYMKKSKGDPPEYGFFELLIYFYLLSCKPKELDEEEVYHKIENRDKFKWSDISKNKFMILAANESYWTYWKKGENDIFNFVAEAQMELGIKICLFNTEDVDFKEQKGNEPFYRPLINNNSWTEVTER